MVLRPTMEICKKTTLNITRNKVRLFIALLIMICLISICVKMPCFAQTSGYHEAPGEGRPPSVFSLCCCTKEEQTANQVFYSCEYIEEESCPENTKNYNVSGFECPSKLMFMKYAPSF